LDREAKINEGGNIRHRGASSPISTTFGEQVGNFIPINEGVTRYPMIGNSGQGAQAREDLREATVSRFDLAVQRPVPVLMA
jgi:hypothetical protein